MFSRSPSPDPLDDPANRVPPTPTSGGRTPAPGSPRPFVGANTPPPTADCPPCPLLHFDSALHLAFPFDLRVTDGSGHSEDWEIDLDDFDDDGVLRLDWDGPAPPSPVVPPVSGPAEPPTASPDAPDVLPTPTAPPPTPSTPAELALAYLATLPTGSATHRGQACIVIDGTGVLRLYSRAIRSSELGRFYGTSADDDNVGDRVVMRGLPPSPLTWLPPDQDIQRLPFEDGGL